MIISIIIINYEYTIVVSSQLHVLSYRYRTLTTTDDLAVHNTSLQGHNVRACLPSD